ncbi:MAG: hypothetical protein ACLP4V_18580 [Methylocella sp.]
MQASRPARWRRSRWWGAIAWVVITFTAMFKTVPAGLAQPGAGHPNPDWPCRQILVGRLSVAAVWAGPSIEGIAWRNEEPIADIVAKLAARRTPVEDAERMIEDFARSQGVDKTKKLIAVFAGLFGTLNDERTQVIEGLLRFGAKQKELADKIRAENALAREGPGKKPDTSKQDAKTVAQDLEWDLRVFDERRQSLTYVCETPTLIEQRLFALAKVIQSNLE